MPDGEPPHPNGLRAAREAASLSRPQLASLTSRAAEESPDACAPVSARSLERLERGETRPLARAAEALARALGASVEALFPLGVSDHARNPEGATRVPEGRRLRGKGKV